MARGLISSKGSVFSGSMAQAATPRRIDEFAKRYWTMKILSVSEDDRTCEDLLAQYRAGREKLVANKRKEAADCFCKVIEHENVLQYNCQEAKEAWFNSHLLLAWFYTVGIGGVGKNLDEAARLYRKVAENGCVMAQHMLGHWYYSGFALDCDYTEAAAWYRKAAEQGYPYAQERLARCYVRGRGVEKNLEEAERWLKKAVANASEGERDYYEARYDSFRRMVVEGNDAYLWYRGQCSRE